MRGIAGYLKCAWPTLSERLNVQQLKCNRVHAIPHLPLSVKNPQTCSTSPSLPHHLPAAVVYIRNAEQLLAGSYDAYHAFIDTFGKTGLEAALEGTASHAPLVLLGGITVNESAAALAGVRPQRQRQAGEGEEEGGDDDDAYRPRSSGGCWVGGWVEGGNGVQGSERTTCR